ncbi:MAG: deoxyribodipyrimidine photo-lyase [Deltaproteobacteria bacterium]|nr:deoxyribodipyrimidine photo-lyase [Deltaproteobacteria bacterium]
MEVIGKRPPGEGPVVYWMSRDQRVADNWALIHAGEEALKRGRPLAVVFCLVTDFLGAGPRHYDFMLRGLREVAADLERKNIPFFMLQGPPEKEVSTFVKRVRAGLLVTDFDPLKIKRRWKAGVSRDIAIPFHEVDAHNIVPCRVASQKQEYAARTFRPRVLGRLEEFLEDFPVIKKHPHPWKGPAPRIDWDLLGAPSGTVPDVASVEVPIPGGKAAHQALRRFIERGLSGYDTLRNDPTQPGQSGLSHYFHFGHLSAQRAVIEVRNSPTGGEDAAAFLEELIVRRELSDNFCYYCGDYDSVKGFPAWARKTLDEHAADEREYLYSAEEFENAATHDRLWNAAQMEMVKMGKMHGYLRMYWAKKILEWTPSAGEALDIALSLNDRYEIDGRDPNGYAGCAWAIGGVHDRPWSRRPVFGTIRYMSYRGCRSKFNVDAYIEKVNRL